MTNNKRIFLFCAIILSGFFIFVGVQASDAVYISQVQITGGSGKTKYDFVEIFNPGNAEFNLKGYRLVKRTANSTVDTLIKSWTKDEIIPAKSFYLWANSTFTGISVAPDITTSGSLSKNNGVAIRFGGNDMGEIIDSIAWGETNNGFTNVFSENPSENQSIKRGELYQSSSAYTISPSSPRNTSIADQAPTTTDPPEETVTLNLPTAGTSDVSLYEKSEYIKLSEILPNPKGKDRGQEQIEIHNSGGRDVNLEGWILGDKSDSGPKKDSYRFGKVTIHPGAFMSVDIPGSYFVLNNSGGETVNLYFTDASLADSVSYSEKAEENMSYQKIGGEWFWQTPSMGKENIKEVISTKTEKKDFAKDKNEEVLETYDYHLVFSEVYPNPAGDAEEFLEILNTGEEQVNLKGVTFYIGSRKKLIKEDLFLGPAEFVAFFEDELPVRLRNSGQVLVLKNQKGEDITSLKYPKAKKGFSYAVNSSGKYAWTGAVTPEDTNEFVLGASSETVKKPLAVQNSVLTPKMEKIYNKVLKTNQSLLLKVTSLEEEVAKLNDTLAALSSKLEVPTAKASGQHPSPIEPQVIKSRENTGLGKLYLIVAFIALVVFIIIIKQFAFKKGKD